MAAGERLIVQANGLNAGEDWIFNGTAELDGSFLIYGGNGLDLLAGGAGDDGFFFGDGRWGGGDQVNGGAGTMDQLGLHGNFNITFGEFQLIEMEFIVLMTAVDTRFGQAGGTASYSLTMNNGNVAAGQTLAISANMLQSGENLSFNGSAETDGRFDIFSGDGNDVLTGGSGDDVIFGGGRGDTLTGGAGNDIFAYRSVTDSNSAERDGIQDFEVGNLIDLSLIDANINVGGNQDFTFVGTNAFTNTAGELRYENISLGGPIWIIQGDVNGDGVSDLEIVYVRMGGQALTADDFIGGASAASLRQKGEHTGPMVSRPVDAGEAGETPGSAPTGGKYEGRQVLPAEPDSTDLNVSRSTERFTLANDDRMLTLDQDGLLAFGPGNGDDDFLVLSGAFVDQPLILPDTFGNEAFEFDRGMDRASPSDFALTLAVADGDPSFGDNWFDASGLYNWC